MVLILEGAKCIGIELGISLLVAHMLLAVSFFMDGNVHIDKDTARKVFLFNCVGFAMFCYAVFIFFYCGLYPDLEKGDLCNPFQVGIQLSLLVFYSRYRELSPLLRVILSQIVLIHVLSTLFIHNCKVDDLATIWIVANILHLKLPVRLVITFPLYLYLFLEFNDWLGFLNLQVLLFVIICKLFNKNDTTAPMKVFYPFFILFISQVFNSFFFWDSFLLQNPLKLTAIVSGTCIIYISWSEITIKVRRFFFLVYFVLSFTIGLVLAPNDTSFLGIPFHLLLFSSANLCSFLIFELVSKNFKLTENKEQQLISIFWSNIFLLFKHLPGLDPLSKWIGGLDLLLLISGILHIVKGVGVKEKLMNEKKKRD